VLLLLVLSEPYTDLASRERISLWLHLGVGKPTSIPSALVRTVWLVFTMKMVTTIKFVNEILKIRDLFPS